MAWEAVGSKYVHVKLTCSFEKQKIIPIHRLICRFHASSASKYLSKTAKPSLSKSSDHSVGPCNGNSALTCRASSASRCQSSLVRVSRSRLKNKCAPTFQGNSALRYGHGHNLP